MGTAARKNLATALLGIVIGVTSNGCADDVLWTAAYVHVVMSSVTSLDAVADFSLSPAVYDFVASGSADADGADIAPPRAGDHGLRIVATDNAGGTTEHERIYTVR